MSKIVVYHSSYGCETGCCGHIIERDGQQVGGFTFSHPYGEDKLAWAKELVTDELGAEHVADLDWDNCYIGED
jgi:hypothetical protein